MKPMKNRRTEKQALITMVNKYRENQIFDDFDDELDDDYENNWRDYISGDEDHEDDQYDYLEDYWDDDDLWLCDDLEDDFYCHDDLEND